MEDVPMRPDEKRQRLIEEIRRGIDSIERGEYEDVNAKDIHAYIARLAPKNRKAK
jgi:hypothetical protein